MCQKACLPATQGLAKDAKYVAEDISKDAKHVVKGGTKDVAHTTTETGKEVKHGTKVRGRLGRPGVCMPEMKPHHTPLGRGVTRRQTSACHDCGGVRVKSVGREVRLHRQLHCVQCWATGTG